ncbi:MAG: peptide deformylase [Minisyncoccia bacterium]
MYKIIEYPNKILRKKVKKVEKFDKNLRNIVNEMKKILIRENAIGLSANQIGLDVAIFIARPKEKFYVFINPEVKLLKKPELKEESCLSAITKIGLVPRYPEVKIVYQDLTGRKKRMKAKGLLAHIIQHEYDHLNGILFLDKAKKIYELKEGEEFELKGI